MKTKMFAIAIQMLLIISVLTVLITTADSGDGPQWPTSWILIDTDDQDSTTESFRDVQYAYFSVDNNYLYFRLQCYGTPNFTEHPKGRYKWFIDVDHNMYLAGGTVHFADYLLFVENSNDDANNTNGTNNAGEIYFLEDLNHDGSIDNDYNDPDYLVNPGPVEDRNIANCSVNGNYVDLWISRSSISDPINSNITWATDQENPNLDQAPNNDKSDNYWEGDFSKADLSVVKYSNPNPVEAGGSLTYMINVTNHGPHNATNITVTDILPLEISNFTSYPAANGGSGSTYWWTYPFISAGETEVITINVTVNNDATGTIINNVQVYSANTTDFVPGNNSFIEETNISQTYSLNITTDGDGSVSKNPDQVKYVNETVVELTANANPGWSFSHWSGDLSGSVNPGSIVMDGDKFVTAHFTEDQYTLNISVFGNGSVVKDPDQTVYLYGDTVNIIAIADLGWRFTKWSGDVDSTNSNETIFMDSSKTVTADFTEDQYTLTVTIDGSGSVSKNPDQNNYTHGENVELTATPSSGWKFDHWSGDISGSSNVAIINMTDGKYVTAHFIKKQGGGGGFVPPIDGGDGVSAPIADAGGPYSGVPDEEILFNGTKSHDNDEGGSSIVSYDWKFFEEDEWHENVGATPIYIYNKSGLYNVTLRVYDDEGDSDINITIATIVQPNIPPRAPQITGPKNGTQNTTYTYFAVSTDENGDSLSYTFDWDDGTEDSTEFIPAGIEGSEDHVWHEAGIYTISVRAFDGESPSGFTELTVLIDVLYVKEIGYLIDNDSDGIYDDFFSNSTDNITLSRQRKDGWYLINDDEDAGWDWIYDPETDTLEPYIPPEKEGFNLLWLLALLLIIIILLIFFLTKKRKKKEDASPSKS